MSDRDDIAMSTRRIRARELATWAHDYAAKNLDKLREAGAWLDRQYSTAAVLERRERAGGDDLSPDIPASAFQLCPSQDMAREALLVIRLNSAIIDLRHDPPDLTSAALEDPLVWAYRVVLVVCLATDRDAGLYAAGLTELGRLVWLSDGACRSWASLDDLLDGRDPLLHMLDDARRVILRVERKARALANPLLAGGPRRRPAPIQRLFDAIIKLECATELLLDGADDPEYADAERYSDEELEQRDIYLDWSDAAHAAIAAVEEAMAAAEPTRPAIDERWLADLRQSLRALISVLHPVVVGLDGRALSQGKVSLPHVRERLSVVASKRLYLMDVDYPSAPAPETAAIPASPSTCQSDATAADHEGRSGENGSRGETAELKSYTQDDLDQAIRRFKATRAKLYDGLRKRIARGDLRAAKRARDIFGRNALARRLQCRARAMISGSPAWKIIKEELRLDWKKANRPGKKVSQEAAETAGPKPSPPSDLAAQEEMLRRIRLLPAEIQNSLLDDIAARRTTPEAAEDIIALYVQQQRDARRGRVRGVSDWS